MIKMITLANRLAEAILFDWDKEEVIKLAKEVAVACHENIEFVSLVKRMREAQRKIKGYSPTRIDKDRCQWENDLDNKAYLESEVDEWLEKMK